MLGWIGLNGNWKENMYLEQIRGYWNRSQSAKKYTEVVRSIKQKLLKNDMWSGNVSLMFIQVHLAQSKSLSFFPMHRYLLCTLWILCDNAFAILLLFSLTSSNSFLFSWRHCFFLAKNKIMTRNGTFLLAKATSTATLARSPRVTIVPYMKMKQYWAKGRILVQRGDVSRGNAFFNQTGNCSSPSPFFALFAIKMSTTPLFLSMADRPERW